ncbi:hypothetical protein AUJ84_02190 [Candidatus Pacearchaeota archaeon CG1_02_32_132]|nr:MAG: hypothetical protein AUJ84_02190 [Candidatus Pacearchaeota archaeon CG1_02_32_132]
MKLFIVRHPQTEYNAKDITHGSYPEFDDGRISELGIKQMHGLVSKTKVIGIDIIISSDLPRCKILAKEISSELDTEIEYSPKLREKDYGDFTGKKNSEINWKVLKGNFEDRKPLNGESLEDLKIRTEDFAKSLVEKYGETDKKIVIVSHSIFIKVFVGNLIGLSLYDSIFKIKVDNCSLIELKYEKKDGLGEFKLIGLFNNQDFLDR